MKLLDRRKVLSLAGLLMLGRGAQGAERWTEGRHYVDLGAPRAQGRVPGAARITEIFSYGCSGCDAFLPFMRGLEKKLPAGVLVEYLPASWHPAENWPLFQRTYLAAKVLGMDKKAHDAMFAAVWKTGELAVIDPRTRRPKSPLPSVQDVARFHERVTGVSAAKFLETARSFAVDSAMRLADARIKALRTDSTPTLVINDRFRVDLRSAGGYEQLAATALFLVEKAQHAS